MEKKKQYNVEVSFERIAFDVTGPFPTTANDNKYILVAMNYFSKGPGAYVTPNQEASSMAQARVDNTLVCRFRVS